MIIATASCSKDLLYNPGLRAQKLYNHVLPQKISTQKATLAIIALKYYQARHKTTVNDGFVGFAL